MNRQTKRTRTSPKHHPATDRKAILYRLGVLTFCFFLLAAAFLIHPATTIAGNLYRWVDEDGVSHYSDEPPVLPSSKGQTPQVKTIRQPLSDSKGPQEFIIPFEQIGAGMLVNVTINGYIPAKMLVDTGASAVKINKKLLDQIKQELPENRRRGYVSTAGGIIKAEEVFIEKMDVGGAIKENVRAIFAHETYDDVYFDGLLGMSFLSDFKMTVDYKNNQIHLKR